MPATSATTIPVPPILVSALTAAGVAGYFDTEEHVVFAHPVPVPRDKALDGLHIVINWKEEPFTDWVTVTATAYTPDGGPDFHSLGTVYATPTPGPVTEEAAQCARAVAESLLQPGRTAGSLLLDALNEYGLTPGDALSATCGTHDSSYDIPVPLSRGAYGRLSVADRAGSVQHVPAAHTGWSIMLHDEWGQAVGGPVYIAGNGDVVDCDADCTAAASFVANWLTSPVSRHCDCYAQERHNLRHDHECNRYRRP